MKKQILFMMFLSLAFVFAGVNNANGQELNYPTATNPAPVPGLNCDTDFGPLNPNPGVNYTYTIQTDPATVSAVHWFVTDDSDVILDGALTSVRDINDATNDYAYILNTEDGETGEDNIYNQVGNADKSIDISWQYFNSTDNEVLLVAYVQGAAGCSDNVEVWRIEPAFSFTLDVVSMADNGTLGTLAAPVEECVSPIESAVYTGGEWLSVDYGTNYVYFSVTAANFVDSWMPDLNAEITSGASVTSVQWAYPEEAVKNDAAGNATGIWNATTVAVEASALATDGVVGAAGENIIVRVQIDHGNVEDPVGDGNTETVTLTIDGIMYDAANDSYENTSLADVDEDTDGNCVQDITDEADYTILPRPLITEVNPATGDGPFEPETAP